MKKNRESILLIMVISILLIGRASASYPGSEEAVVRAVEMVEPAVVNVKTLWQNSMGQVKVGMGSGVIISKEGWIITNAHVTRNARKIYITLNDGRTIQVDTWRANASEDIAVLKVNGANLPVAPIGDSNRLKKGQIAIAIGNPWRFSSTVTVGCISATGRLLDAGGIILKDMVQTDAAINPGNSGGALVNSNGQVVGINTLVYTGEGNNYVQGLSFAIPINQAIRTANALIAAKDNVQQQAWLGVIVMNLTQEIISHIKINKGVMITGFPPNSPANNAGLQIGDVIVQIDDYQLNNTAEFQQILRRYRPGDSITITVVRGRKKLRGQIQLEGMRQ